jgi:hypothetical protein
MVRANAECDGDGRDAGTILTTSLAGLCTAVRRAALMAGEDCPGEWEFLPFVEALGVTPDVDEGSGGGNLTGKGKRGPLSFLRLGRRKNVVVVDTVWVVVVVAYIP